MTGILRRTGSDVPAAPVASDSPASSPASASVYSQTRTSFLPEWWWLALVTTAYPVLYLLGLAAFSWIIVGCAILPSALARRPVRVPPGTGTWLLFIAWVLVSAVAISSVDRGLAYVYRLLVYLGATGFFLRTYNSIRSGRLSMGRVLGFLTSLWAGTVICGLIAEVFPRLRVPTLMEAILPQSLLRQEFLAALVRAEFAQVQNLFGVVIGRPNAPFPYTNIWGSVLAVLFPIAIAWLVGGWGTRRSRAGVTVLMLLSVAPVIVSLNRGLWVCLIVTTFWVAIRLAAVGRIGGLVRVMVGAGLVAALLIATPLGSLGNERRENAHSDEGRMSLYIQAIDLASESPIFGWGAPQPRTDKDGPSVGTHGQMWTVLVSQGIVGLLIFLSFWAVVALKTWHLRSTADIWLHSAIVSGIVQMPFYDMLPPTIPLLLMATAVLLAARAAGTSIDRPRTTATPT